MHKKTFCLAPGSACHHTFSPSVSSFSREPARFYKSGHNFNRFWGASTLFGGRCALDVLCKISRQYETGINVCRRRKALMRLSHGCDVWFHGAENAFIIHLLQTAGKDVIDTEGGVGCDISWNVVYPSNKPITCCSVTRGCSAYIQVPSSRRRAHLMNMNSRWQPQRRPSLLDFINTSDPIDGRTVAMDKSCIYCTNTALSGSTLTHSSACVRTEGDPFQLLCVGVCQQCSWRQSPLWRPVFRIDTGPRSACSQGPTWGLMNNGERILRAKGEFASLTGLVMSLNYVFMYVWRQVKLWSSTVELCCKVRTWQMIRCLMINTK